MNNQQLIALIHLIIKLIKKCESTEEAINEICEAFDIKN